MHLFAMVCNDRFNSFINSFRKKKFTLFLGNYSLHFTFILSVTGTFLVRSGILNSVHTFASDPSRGLFIFNIFKFINFFFSIFYLKKLKKKINFEVNSKETFILINNWFMMFYLITVLLGTIYPIFTEVL